MEAKKFIEPALEKRGLVIMTNLDVVEPSMQRGAQASYRA
jgi:hypothetical protein